MNISEGLVKNRRLTNCAEFTTGICHHIGNFVAPRGEGEVKVAVK